MKSNPSATHPPPDRGTVVRPRFFYRQWLLAGNPVLFFDRLLRDFGDFVHDRGLFSFYLVNHAAHLIMAPKYGARVRLEAR